MYRKSRNRMPLPKFGAPVFDSTVSGKLWGHLFDGLQMTPAPVILGLTRVIT